MATRYELFKSLDPKQARKLHEKLGTLDGILLKVRWELSNAIDVTDELIHDYRLRDLDTLYRDVRKLYEREEAIRMSLGPLRTRIATARLD